jgi:hypothetical protein
VGAGLGNRKVGISLLYLLVSVEVQLGMLVLGHFNFEHGGVTVSAVPRENDVATALRRISRKNPPCTFETYPNYSCALYQTLWIKEHSALAVHLYVLNLGFFCNTYFPRTLAVSTVTSEQWQNVQ